MTTESWAETRARLEAPHHDSDRYAMMADLRAAITRIDELERALDFSPVVDDSGAVWLHIQHGGNAVCLHYANPTAGYDDMRALREWAENIHKLLEDADD